MTYIIFDFVLLVVISIIVTIKIEMEEKQDLSKKIKNSLNRYNKVSEKLSKLI